MNLTDLLQPLTDDVDVQVLHVQTVLGSGARFTGYVGRNLLTAYRSADFTDTVVAGDLVETSLNEQGILEATALAGSAALISPSTYDLPDDFAQVPVSDVDFMAKTGLSILPPAQIVCTLPAARAAFGTYASQEISTTLYWGHSTFWVHGAAHDNEAGRKLSLVLADPVDVDVDLHLLSAHQPGDVHTGIDTVTVSLSYWGPDVANVIDLDPDWITALGDGSAGAIRISPNVPGPVRHLVVGRARSLSLHT